MSTFYEHPVECGEVEEHGEKVEDAGDAREHVRLYLRSQFWYKKLC